MSNNIVDYPWYTIVDNKDELLQGDIVNSCPIVNPTIDLEDGTVENINTNVNVYDVVIMSQSCDLVNKKIDLVLVCPIYNLADVEESDSSLKNKKIKEQIRQGNVPGYHLLNKSKDVGLDDYLLVDFRNIYGVPFNFIKELVKKREKRLRLLPPYREHLSQSFARFFMRVGLPVDIPKFT